MASDIRAVIGTSASECGPLSRCARSGHVDALDHGPGVQEPETDLPHEAVNAVVQAVMRYEPEAAHALIENPGALASVLLEASRRAVTAAAPYIRGDADAR